MNIQPVPLNSVARLDFGLTNPSTGGYIPSADVTLVEAEYYVGSSGYPNVVGPVTNSGVLDGLYAVALNVSPAVFEVGDLVNVFARLTYDGVTYAKSIGTLLIDPPVLTGVVATGTATNTASAFRTNIEEGRDLSLLITAHIWLRSSDWVTLSGAEVTDWAPRQGVGTFSQASSALRPALSGGVIAFDGTDDYMTTANSTQNQASTGMTLALRVTVDSTSGSRTLIGKGNLSSCDWIVQLVSNEFRFWVNGYTNGGYVTSFFPSTGTYTVIIVYDGFGSTDADKVKIWLDGVQATLSFYGTIPSSINNGGYSVGLGALSSGNQPFDGSFTEVFFSKSAATSDQVAKIHTTLTGERENFWAGNLLLFTSGELTGQMHKISSFTRNTRFMNFTNAFTKAPTVGDTFIILAS